MAIASGIGRRSSRDVALIATCWDGWVEGQTAGFGISNDMIINGSSSILTRYGYRQVVKSDGAAYPHNWYTYNSGNTAAEQAVVDDQAFMLGEAGITARSFLWYPHATDITSGPATNVSNIVKTLDYYMSSENKAAHKFCVVLQSFWAAYDVNSPGTWLNLPAFRARWLNWFLDAQYLKVGTRPVIGIYQSGATLWDTTHLDLVRNDCTGAGLGTPYFIHMNLDATDANALGLDGITRYGPSPVTGLGSGSQTYAALSTNDKAGWSVSGSNQERVLPITQRLDTRPRAYAFTFSDPTYTEFETRLRRDYAMARSNRGLCANSLMALYSINEVDEGGAFFPTPQDLVRGVNTPSRGPQLDAFKNVVYASFPSTYDDHYHATSTHAAIVRTGGANWTTVQDLTGASGGTTGAYKYSENRNSTVTNTWVFTSPYNVTRLKLYGGKGVAYGTFNVKIDAGADTLITQTAVSETRNQLLFDSGALAAGVHSLTCTVVTGCFIDELVATVSR